ncbi:hypothetical protein F4775DRAFT_534742 [Biscogniauxia sp. FL1348]|nr:hypothetical protein F4775DRAFT_580731 [Biscogniauxia sp. FL1348]KAI0602612.1 hypothetical protein F4775DRAFT_534742 [Biscogniauxia sp. FL1348]
MWQSMLPTCSLLLSSLSTLLPSLPLGSGLVWSGLLLVSSGSAQSPCPTRPTRPSRTNRVDLSTLVTDPSSAYSRPIPVCGRSGRLLLGDDYLPTYLPIYLPP